MAYLYRHIRLDKNEPFNIGIGEDTEKNQGKYLRAYSIKSRNKYWKNIINLTSYEIEIMLDNLTWEEACIKETEFIKLYGRKDLGLGPLVNMTEGGEGAYNPSKETRTRKSKTSKETYKNNPEIIEKRRETQIKYWQTHPDVIEQIYKKRNITFKENPQIQIDRVNKIDWKTVGAKISKNRDHKKLAKSLFKPLIQLSMNNEFIKEWSSGKEVQEILGIKKASISQNLKGRSNSAGGFKWKYK